MLNPDFRDMLSALQDESGDDAMQRYEYQVIVEQDEDGVFVAEVLNVRACYAQGKTFEEAIANIRDVLQMCLQEMRARGDEIPPPNEFVGLTRVEVTV